MLMDKEFYVLCRDELYTECIWDKRGYVKRLVVHGRKKDLEHFFNKGYLCKMSTPERKGIYYDICCCLLRHKKTNKDMIEYILSSDAYVSPFCDGCIGYRSSGLIDNINFLLSYVRN
ncbi:Hypothetical protein ZAZAV_225 [Cedratvirus Zaza IHUMI]|uniref:Uncharacterized protein n=1 Tax=Cedratvirus Zaza IHUMI TaxID=2126979 RepID=A0A2R8FDY5_9VIRU|nr:Hypothetical protein ZAZAV_225 [Cedratvirus Zaza IHUMI]